jgi:glucose/arabinose dehydrogenase
MASGLLGREYYGSKIGEGTHKEGMTQPILHWTPAISPSGFTIYSGEEFPQWKGNIFLANLASRHLRRVVLEGTKSVKQEELLKDLDYRFRHVIQGPDGLIYFSTDDGILARLKKE